MHQWAFNIETFARIYGKKFGIETPKMMKRLWDDSFSNAKEKVWANVQGDGDDALPRSSCQFIMTPTNRRMNATPIVASGYTLPSNGMG